MSAPVGIRLIVRGDDFAMCHSVNEGIAWRPLTNGPSLASPDGTFRPSVELARDHVQHDEVVGELLAQVDRFRSAGISLDYLDHHMGLTRRAAYAEVSEVAGVPFVYSDEVRRGLTTISELSPRDSADKNWLGSGG